MTRVRRVVVAECCHGDWECSPSTPESRALPVVRNMAAAHAHARGHEVVVTIRFIPVDEPTTVAGVLADLDRNRGR